MERRQALTQAGFAATGFLLPVAAWQAPADSPHLLIGTRRVGHPDVETVQAVTSTFRQLDNRFGGGQAREAVVRFLDGDVIPLLRNGRYESAVGLSLTSAVAELVQLAGWMSYDDGLHGLAQRYMVQALRLARAARDLPLGVEILAAMSHQCTYLGNPTEAVELAEAASRSARTAGVPALVAEAEVMAAHAHATAGNDQKAAQAVSLAEASLDQADRSQDPSWIRYFDEAYLSAKFGHTFVSMTGTRPTQQAITFAARSLEMNPAYVRGRMFNLALLARAYLQQKEPLAALEPARTALTLTADLSSKRAVDYLADLNARFRPFESEPGVTEFQRDAKLLLDMHAPARRKYMAKGGN